MAAAPMPNEAAPGGPPGPPAGQYDGVNFEEELAMAKQEKDGEQAEYERMLQLARRAKGTGELDETVRAIVAATDDPLEDTEENVAAIVRYCVGGREEWCSGGPEAVAFETLIAESVERDWAQFCTAHPGVGLGEATRKLPPRYIVPPMPQTQAQALAKQRHLPGKPHVGAARVTISYHDAAGNLCSTLRDVPFTHPASLVLDEVVAKIQTVLNIPGVSSAEYMLKVVGRLDFVYGPETFVNFRFVRDCLVKELPIHLYVMRLPFPSETLRIPRFVPSYRLVEHRHTDHDAIHSANLFRWRSDDAPKASLPASPLAASPDGAGRRASLTAGDLWGAPDGGKPQYLSQWELAEPCRITFVELANLHIPVERCRSESLRDGDDVYVCCVVELVFGGRTLCPPERTPWRKLRGAVGANKMFNVEFGSAGTIAFEGAPLSRLPREVKVCISVACAKSENYARVAHATAPQLLDELTKNRDESMAKLVSIMSRLPMFETEADEVPGFFLASVNVQLFDHDGVMRSGTVPSLRMWSSETKANAISGSVANPDPAAVAVRLQLPQFALPVVHPTGVPPASLRREMEVAHHDRVLELDVGLRDNKIAQLRRIKAVLATDPLYEVTQTDRVLLWQFREDLTGRPKALAKFLLAVDWLSPAAVRESHELMRRWTPMQPVDALELLDARYADTEVRQYAVDCLDTMSDTELKHVLLQLVQVLKYEPYHFSSLARFLLKRSLASPHIVGHTVFWHLKAELSNPTVSERHGLIATEYLRRLQSRRDILRQNHVVMLLLDGALKVKESRRHERLSDLRQALDRIDFPPSFTLALNPSMECTGVVISKCKVMDSKKLPLWLVFKNADPLGPNIYVIFKAGDDLRQDLLTLQMLELMDNVWKSSGVDLHLTPYGCVATGEGIGMIEVVLSSDTIANITRKDGGPQAAFSEVPLMNYLRRYNRTEADVERCLWNFVYSTAGYCVATYILGIGDRHNDNIMLREDGTLFHIDFGHFLGNFKTKFGFKRETTPFVFTPMFAYMMGGSNSAIYKHFVDVACQAYNIIRRQTNMLITLFLLMLSTGIPELQHAGDIVWLKTVLLQEHTDDQAAKHYKQKIEDALVNKRQLLNDYFHILAH